MRSRSCSLLLLVLVLVLMASACQGTPEKPSVVLNSPPHGSQFREGEDIPFQSTATDSKGIARVELVVNGATVRTDQSPNPQGQASFTLVQSWKATQGTHTVAVRAYNTANVMSDPAIISISVGAGPGAPTATSSAPPAATAITAATATTAPVIVPTQAATVAPTSSACTNNAAFVADVTVPDGTAFVANQAFNKIWRVKNTGTCAWGVGYNFAFAGGDGMAATTTIAVPNTAPGATADLLVAMVAPAATGAHTAQWRLKAPGGAAFGAALTVVINVIDPSAPPEPTTVPPTPVPPSGACSGAPAISTFTVSPTALMFTGNVTLAWGAVTNADSVEIDQGIGGVGTPGSVVRNVAPNTTFTLTARCGANTATRQVTVNKSNILLPPITFIPIFTVTEVTATSSVSGLSFCGSRTYVFSGTVKASGSGNVQYRWEKDGVSVQTGSLHFDASGTKSVNAYTFKPGSSHPSGKVRLHTTSPTDKASGDLNYSCLAIIGP